MYAYKYIRVYTKYTHIYSLIHYSSPTTGKYYVRTYSPNWYIQYNMVQVRIMDAPGQFFVEFLLNVI